MRFDGTLLKALRVSKKWDQHRLAEAARAHGVGITQSQISRYENGQEPSARNALALATALDVRVEDFFVANGSEPKSDDDEEVDPVSDLMRAIRRLARAEATDVVRAELAKERP